MQDDWIKVKYDILQSSIGGVLISLSKAMNP